MARRDFSMVDYFNDLARDWKPLLTFQGSTEADFEDWQTRASEKFFELSGRTEAQHVEEVRRLASETVHTSLILRAVARTEKIEVTDEDLSRAIAGTAMQNDLSPEVLAQRLASEGRLGLIKFDILKRKALHFILEKAEIEEKPSTLQPTRPEAP